jgi:hypothetical protein
MDVIADARPLGASRESPLSGCSAQRQEPSQSGERMMLEGDSDLDQGRAGNPTRLEKAVVKALRDGAVF